MTRLTATARLWMRSTGRGHNRADELNAVMPGAPFLARDCWRGAAGVTGDRIAGEQTAGGYDQVRA